MKLAILFGFFACVAAIPLVPTSVSSYNLEKSYTNTPFFTSGNYGKDYFYKGWNRNSIPSGSWNHQDNLYEIAQFIAYQLHHAQIAGYTPTQFSEYLSEYGLPLIVVEYLTEQYQAGSRTELNFASPYEVFQYYTQHGVPQEVLQYLSQQFNIAHQTYQRNYPRVGFQAGSTNFQDANLPILKFIVEFGRIQTGSQYYNSQSQHGVSYAFAYYSYQQLLMAEQYFQTVLRELNNGPQEYYTQLRQVLYNVQQLKNVFNVYQQGYSTQYITQHLSQQFEGIFKTIENVILYVQQHQNTYPRYIIEQLQFGYFATRTVYQTYQNYKSVEVSDDKVYQSFVLKMSRQYAEDILEFLQKYDSQSTETTVPQEFVKYIVQQLELITEISSSSDSQASIEQILSLYKNLWVRLQSQFYHSQGFVQFLTYQVKNVYKTLYTMYQQVHQGDEYLNFGEFTKYGENSFDRSSSSYKYGPYSRNYGMSSNYAGYGYPSFLSYGQDYERYSSTPFRGFNSYGYGYPSQSYYNRGYYHESPEIMAY